jgi:hypothetical protein
LRLLRGEELIRDRDTINGFPRNHFHINANSPSTGQGTERDLMRVGQVELQERPGAADVQLGLAMRSVAESDSFRWLIEITRQEHPHAGPCNHESFSIHLKMKPGSTFLLFVTQKVKPPTQLSRTRPGLGV